MYVLFIASLNSPLVATWRCPGEQKGDREKRRQRERHTHTHRHRDIEIEIETETWSDIDREKRDTQREGGSCVYTLVLLPY